MKMQSKDGHVGSEIGVMLPQAEGAPGATRNCTRKGAEPRSEERARPRPLRSLTHLFLFSKYYQNSYFTGGGRAQRNYQLD